jgi:hypothetical protein
VLSVPCRRCSSGKEALLSLVAPAPDCAMTGQLPSATLEMMDFCM